METANIAPNHNKDTFSQRYSERRLRWGNRIVFAKACFSRLYTPAAGIDILSWPACRSNRNTYSLTGASHHPDNEYAIEVKNKSIKAALSYAQISPPVFANDPSVRNALERA
jgi:hypothetical protein